MSWLLRKRVPSETVTGANTLIRAGAFGTGSPAFAFADVNPNNVAGIYNYHEGDLFTPGAGNFVFEPNFELPMITIWGRAFMRPQFFRALQPPQIMSYATVRQNGIGGLIAGQIELQALEQEVSS